MTGENERLERFCLISFTNFPLDKVSQNLYCLIKYLEIFAIQRTSHEILGKTPIIVAKNFSFLHYSSDINGI